MKENVFLREKGLNHDFKLKGGDFNGTLLELLTEYASSLQPISEEEIEKKFPINPNPKDAFEREYNNVNSHRQFGAQWLLSRGVAKELPTDEEIKKVARVEVGYAPDIWDERMDKKMKIWIKGAMWVRKKWLSMTTNSKEITTDDVREEWIRLAKEESEWISVDTALPEKGELVLMYRESTTIPDTYFASTGAYGFFNKGIWGDQEKDNWKVSHWQPLPKPPLEVK